MSKATYVLKMSTAWAVAALALSYGAAVALQGIGMTPVRGAAANDASNEIRQPAENSPSSSPIATGSLGDPNASETPAGDHAARDLPSPVGETAPADISEGGPAELTDFGAGLARTGALTMPQAQPVEETQSPQIEPVRTETTAPPPTPSPLQNVELLEVPKPASSLVPEERIIEIGPKKAASSEAAATEQPETARKSKQKSRKAAKARKRKTQDPVLSFFGIE